MVHISEIAHSYVENVSDFLSEGQAVKVKVVSIDEAGRINLSIKKATPPPPRPQGFAGTGRAGLISGAETRNFGGNNHANHQNTNPTSPASPEPLPHRPLAGRFRGRLKQFMQASDSKLSDLKMTEKRSSRRGGHR